MKVSSYGWNPPELHQIVHNDILRRHVGVIQVSTSSGYISDVIFPSTNGFSQIDRVLLRLLN